MNDIADIYNSALSIVEERGEAYGEIENNFKRAAIIATMKLNTQISAYDIAVIMESVKDARRAVDPGHADSHIDGLNYKAFAMMLAPIKEKKEKPAPAKAPAPSPKAPPAKRGRGRPPKAK
jgi:hypothetical protein